LRLRASKFESERDAFPKDWSPSFADLREALASFREGPKTGPCWSPTEYPAGAKRGNKAVLSLSCLCLDFDGGHAWEDLADLWDEQGLAYALHTTWRSSPESPRWRAVFPLARPVPASEWPDWCARATEALGCGLAEPHTDPARLYYLPSCPPGAGGSSLARDGAWLDPGSFPAPETADTLGGRPGDRYNAENDPGRLLELAGGTLFREAGGLRYYTRPGKPRGVSATVGLGGGGLVHVHTTEWPGLPPGRYDAFGLYARLEHNGDFKAAARALGPGPAPAPKAVLFLDGPDAGLPNVETAGRQARDVLDDALACLARANDPPRWFAQNGRLVELAAGAVRPLTEAAMAERLARAADWTSSSPKGTRPVQPPKYVAAGTLTLGEWSFAPPLKGVSHCPFLAPDGRLVTENGYDAGSGVFLAAEPSGTWEGGGRRAAEWLLDELLGDFPWAGEADRAGAFALMLTPFLRFWLKGPSPLVVFDAPSPGTGKTLAAQTCLHPGCGLVGVKAPPSREEDWQKALVSLVAACRPAVLIDNVKGRLSSPALMAMVTGSKVEERILGGNEVYELEVRTVFVATANNARLEEDFVSRSLYVRLDSRSERPEERTGFRHPDLLAWLGENRAKAVSACLAVVQGWLDAGAPDGDAPPTRFGAWARALSGILGTVGVPGLLGNLEELRAANDDDRTLRAAVLAEVRAATGGEDFFLEDWWDQLITMEAFSAWAERFSDAKSPRRSLGIAMSHMVGQVLDGLRLERGPKGRKGRALKVVACDTKDGGFSVTPSVTVSVTQDLYKFADADLSETSVCDTSDTNFLYKRAKKENEVEGSRARARVGGRDFSVTSVTNDTYTADPKGFQVQNTGQDGPEGRDTNCDTNRDTNCDTSRGADFQGLGPGEEVW
jgi:hypothetical protein